MGTCDHSKVGRRILEREHELAELAQAAREAADGTGSVVLVYGEAGIGKSSMVDAARGRIPAEGRMLVGHCDDLATARVLGPFRDLIGSVGTELTGALRDGSDRDRILTALHTELDWTGHPTVLAVEDVHWADDATLDVLRYLARRIDRLPVVLMLTFRDDELGREHPLRQVLGLVSGSSRTRRMPLRRLSPEAVRELSAGAGVDTEEVFAVTSGNPFFVGEVLASGASAGVPRTVVDSVLARLRRLDQATRDAVEQLSVVPNAIDRRLVDALVSGGLPALITAEEFGLLAVAPDRVTFRHELTRRAIADALPASRRTALNAQVLGELCADSDATDLARVVHHAAEAGDVGAIVRYGPAAARAAADGRAHREAAAHYRLMLRHRSAFSTEDQAELLERSAIETYTTGDRGRSAVADQREAVALRRQLGDPVALGASQRWLSRMLWWHGDRPGAEAAAREAVAVLEEAGDSRMLAMAYSNESQLDMLAERNPEAIATAERAIALARDAGDAAVLSHALNNRGSARWMMGELEIGRQDLDESLRVALAAGQTEHALRAYVNLVWELLRELRPAQAAIYLDEAMELAERAEYISFLQYLSVGRGIAELAFAHWQPAIEFASAGLESPRPIRCAALTVIARARVRTGEPADDVLRECWNLARDLDELQRIGPAAVVVCEDAWLRGDLGRVREVARPVYELASGRDHRTQAELALWLSRAGEQVPVARPDHPFALQQAGSWQDAVKAWEEAGYPYERAAAMADSPETADQIAAVAELDLLGAVPLAQLVRRRLRAQGTRVPRGPAAATREHPAGLTERQQEVLALLAEGLTNAEIADRLVLSVRTAANHVAAVLEKLGVHSREEAVARSRDLGIGPATSE